jgi:uncharacterized protein (DUF305 family)
MFNKLVVLLLAVLATGWLTACAAGGAPSANQAQAPTGGQAVEHDMAAMSPDAPYDAIFIDSMIVHHEGAIEMARQALEQAEQPEIKAMAEAIIEGQQAEIDQMQGWRTAWFPDQATVDVGDMDMGPMEVSDDAGKPFDQRFIEAMIPHHEGALAMAKDVLQNAERSEVKELAQTIITAQEAEIAQMKQWLQDWYGQ